MHVLIELGSMENLAFDPAKINELLNHLPFSFSSLRIGELRVENIDSPSEFKLQVVLNTIEGMLWFSSSSTPFHLTNSDDLPEIGVPKWPCEGVQHGLYRPGNG
jgi:hypothetical protein